MTAIATWGFDILFWVVTVVPTWSLIFTVTLGIGLLVQHVALGKQGITPLVVMSAYWLGFCTILIVTQLWNFAFPVNYGIRVIFLVLAIIGLTWNARVIRWIFSIKSWIFWGFIAVLVVVVSLDAYLYGQVRLGYDSGLYHIQAMLWANEYPVVTGMGLIHGRLAFNNGMSLYGSIWNFGHWEGLAGYLGHVPLHIATLLTIFAIYLHSKVRLVKYASVFFAVAVAYQLFNEYVYGMMSDPIIFILQTLVIMFTANLIFDTTLTKRERYWQISVLTLLAGAIISCKISGAIIALGCVLIAWFALRDHHQENEYKTFFALLLLGCIIVVPMIIRSVIVSGYLVYPIVITAVDVPWRIPTRSTELEYYYIKTFAQYREYLPMPDEPRDPFSWIYTHFIPAVHRSDMKPMWFIIPFSLHLTFSGLFILSPKMRKAPSLYHALIALNVLAILYWFYSAPDRRFAGASIWGSSILLMVLAFDHIEAKFREISVFAFAFMMLVLSTPIFTIVWSYGFGYRDIPSVPELQTVTNDNDLTFYTPSFRDQCWFAPLPCAPGANRYSALRLIDPDNMARGFTLAPPEEPEEEQSD